MTDDRTDADYDDDVDQCWNDEADDPSWREFDDGSCRQQCDPMCDWCLVAHECPDQCGGGDECPYRALEAGR